MKNCELNPVGPAFEELTLEEMVASQGSGDVKSETTYVCLSMAGEAISYVAISYATKKC